MGRRRTLTPQEARAYELMKSYRARRNEMKRLDAVLHGERSDCARRIIPGGISWGTQRREEDERTARRLFREQEIYYEMMRGLTPMERSVIRMRYEEERGWIAISQRVYLCERQAQRVHNMALKKMAEALVSGNFLDG